MRRKLYIGAEMHPMVVSGIITLTGDVPVSYWPIFFPVPSARTFPEVFAKVNSAQLPSRF